MQKPQKTLKNKAAKIRNNRTNDILTALDNSSGMTCGEIAEYLYRSGKLEAPDPQLIRPRMAELSNIGRVEVVDRRRDPVTGRRNAVWKRRK